MLNGFGDPAEIETQRAALADENDVDVAYDGADMSNRDAIRMMVERAVARFGQVDIVVNNAGIQHVAPIGEFPPAKWDAILAINLSSAFHLDPGDLRADEASAATAASSTSPRRTAWSPRPSSRPMSRPSTAWSA